MRETQEFKFRAFSGQGMWSLWLRDLRYEEKRVPRLSMKPLQYRVATGGVAPTQFFFFKVLLQRTPDRTNPALSFLCV